MMISAVDCADGEKGLILTFSTMPMQIVVQALI